ncbi:MAG: nucleotidyl transferase AbiEii/AbiGii toxin family protein [Lentisphaeria bacterium]|nr:nucleotidyl transferase AbiEii/AbiGii toxin family protein [Lentisphaeria bacterium]
MKKDLSASVRSKLLNLARNTGRDFQEITQRYVIERFLQRLSLSEHKQDFILKGAMLYVPWKLDDKRTTMDLDLLGFGNPDIKELKQKYIEICSTKVQNDGLIFHDKNVQVTAIREESLYDGVRIKASISLGSMRIRLQIDIGFGDQIVPEPIVMEFPALLNKTGPSIRSYSPETVIAEKFNAMIVLGMANSRLKDYFDIWMLSKHFEIKADLLRRAIIQTFEKRQTPFPEVKPVGLSDEFYQEESKTLQWKGFIRKQRHLNSLPELNIIGQEIETFLLPVVLNYDKNSTALKTWSPEKGWL